MNAVLQLAGVMLALTLPVILIIAITEYFKNKKNTNAEMTKLREQMELNSTKELKDEVAKLRERIEVLERIVTDNSYEVERKIQSL